MEQIEIVNKLMALVDDVLHGYCTNTHTSSGTPMDRGSKIINNHRVEVYAIIGTLDKKIHLEVDRSTKHLTLAEAIAILVS